MKVGDIVVIPTYAWHQAQADPGQTLTFVKRSVNGRIHNAHVFEHTWDDWDAVVDVLAQMQRVVVGEDDRHSHRFRH